MSDENQTTDPKPETKPAPEVAGLNSLLAAVTGLEQRIEALEAYAREQGAKLDELTRPKQKTSGRYFRD